MQRRLVFGAVFFTTSAFVNLKNNSTSTSLNSFLSRNQTAFKTNYYKIHSNTIPSNDPSEDRQALNDFNKNLLCSVFDGHSGSECSQVLSEHLHSYVAAKLSKINSRNLNQKDRSQLVSNAIKSAFLEMDRDLLKGAFLDKYRNPFTPALAGSCAILAYIEDQKHLYIASTGDCRAVLGKRIIDGSFQTVQLSDDQTIKNPHEYERMIELHPKEQSTLFVRGRVLGGLMPTRAFGDARYKWPLDIMNPILDYLYAGKSRKRRPSTPSNYFTPPYVTAEPEVVHYTLESPKMNGDVLTGDLFLVVGCDGIYDELESEDVVSVVEGWMVQQNLLPSLPTTRRKEYIDKFVDTKDENAVTHLIRNALHVNSKGRIEDLLSIPAPKCRRYRDDMSAYCVFFGDAGPKGDEGGNVLEVDMGLCTDKIDRVSKLSKL